MNRHKVHHPVGFFDQYQDVDIANNYMVTFLTTVQEDLIVRDMGVSLAVTLKNNAIPLTIRDMGVSIFVTKAPGHY